MLAFRVQLNDLNPVTGGAPDLSVLNVILTAVGRLGPNTRHDRYDEDVEVDLRLGGLTSRGANLQDEHLTWLAVSELKPGDKIVVEVVETEEANPVLSASKKTGHDVDERSYFEHCKRAYLELREKYETSD